MRPPPNMSCPQPRSPLAACPNANELPATARASTPAPRIVFVMDSSPSCHGSTLAPTVVFTAVVALAAVPGVRIVVLWGSSAAGEARRAGVSGRLVHCPPCGRRPRCGGGGCGRHLTSGARGDRQRERAGSENALCLGLCHGSVSFPALVVSPPVHPEQTQVHDVSPVERRTPPFG